MIYISCIFLVLFFGTQYSETLARYVPFYGRRFWAIVAILNGLVSIIYLKKVWPLGVIALIAGAGCVWVSVKEGAQTLQDKR
jgi:hypothetical protein